MNLTKGEVMKKDSLIKALREESGHTLISLSDCTGIPVKFLRDLENGRIEDFGNGGKLFTLANHLEVDTDELLDALEMDLGYDD